MPTAKSDRARLIHAWFGLDKLRVEPKRACERTVDVETIIPGEGGITLVVGASGSGKSSLLRAVRSKLEKCGSWIDVNALRLPDVPTIDCLDGVNIQEALQWLSRVGLAEVWTWLRTPAELSDGQRWRLKLAIALTLARASHCPILCCDEFAAALDRITAGVVARTVRKSVVRPMRALIATSHQDLAKALQPDVLVQCDFGAVRIACPSGHLNTRE